MISLDNRPVEIVEPASPPHSEKDASSAAADAVSAMMSSCPPSPEIRVTDTPEPSSPASSGSHSPTMTGMTATMTSMPAGSPTALPAPTSPFW